MKNWRRNNFQVKSYAMIYKIDDDDRKCRTNAESIPTKSINYPGTNRSKEKEKKNQPHPIWYLLRERKKKKINL